MDGKRRVEERSREFRSNCRSAGRRESSIRSRVNSRSSFMFGRSKRTGLLLAAAVFLLAASGFFGMDRINAKADNEKTSAVQKYYTSIEIQDGDSLWSIAAQYKEKSGKTTGELVDELKQMNSLSEDTIHAGHYLVIPYYLED